MSFTVMFTYDGAADPRTFRNVVEVTAPEQGYAEVAQLRPGPCGPGPSIDSFPVKGWSGIHFEKDPAPSRLEQFEARVGIEYDEARNDGVPGFELIIALRALTDVLEGELEEESR